MRQHKFSPRTLEAKNKMNEYSRDQLLLMGTGQSLSEVFNFWLRGIPSLATFFIEHLLSSRGTFTFCLLFDCLRGFYSCFSALGYNVNMTTNF